MFGKELRYRVFSMLFLVVSAGILLMIYSNFVPEKWYLYAEPLSFQKFAYIELRDACERGSIQLYGMNGEMQQFENVLLQPEDKDRVERELKRMNPEYARRRKIG